MEASHRPDPMLARSVIVTGTHYSTTTLVGALLQTAPEFHLLHEPLNPQPTLSYDSLKPPRWYEYYDASRYDELHDALARLLRRGPVLPETARRLARARTRQELGQALRYLQRRLPSVVSRRPAIFKDPFLAFSAHNLQEQAGLKVVWCLRHPGAFAESFIRKTEGFPFEDLASQPALLDMMDDDAEQVLAFARERQPACKQAALLWRVVNGFAERHLLANSRTASVRQEDFIDSREDTAKRLLTFVGGSRTPALRRFMEDKFGSAEIDQGSGSYTKRDPRMAAEKWRGRLSREDAAIVREMTGPLAARLGYGEDSWSR
ncbi:hypothetical protein ACXYL9_01360 [Qipengyuania sp. CAU 1752]